MMIKRIQRAVEEIITIFQLSLDYFSENLNMFYLTQYEYTIVELDIDKMFRSLNVFGGNIEVVLRDLTAQSLKGTSSTEEVEDFNDWVIANKGYKVQLSITLKKIEFINENLKCSCNCFLYINPQKFKDLISYVLLEDKLITDYKHTVILFPMWDMSCLTNEYLSLVGSSYGGLIQQLILNDSENDISTTVKKKMYLQKLNCNMGNAWERMLPEHLYFPNSIQDPFGLLEKCNYFVFLMCLHFISNISTKDEFSIHGYKNIRIKVCPEAMTSISNESVALIFSIYENIYSSQSSQTLDKLLIVRNVMSVHLPDECDIKVLANSLSEIFSSVSANYDSYVQDKIKSFFEKKKDLEKYVRDTSEAVSKQISSVSDNLTKSWFALMGALVASVIIHSSRYSLLIFGLFLSFYGIVSYITLRHSVYIANKEKEFLEISFKHFISLVDGVNEEQKGKIVGGIIESKINLLNETMSILSEFGYYSSIFILLFMYVFIIYYHISSVVCNLPK